MHIVELLMSLMSARFPVLTIAVAVTVDAPHVRLIRVISVKLAPQHIYSIVLMNGVSIQSIKPTSN